jgi:hypothetical protein
VSEPANRFKSTERRNLRETTPRTIPAPRAQANGARAGRKAHGFTPEDEELVKRRLRLNTGPLFDAPKSRVRKPLVSMKEAALEAVRIAGEEGSEIEKYRRKFNRYRVGGSIIQEPESAYQYGHCIAEQHAGPINAMTTLFMSGHLLEFSGTIIWWTFEKALEKRRSFIWATLGRLECISDFFDEEARVSREFFEGNHYAAEGGISYRYSRAKERLTLNSEELPEVHKAWNSRLKHARSMFRSKPEDPYEQVMWYQDQGDRLLDIHRAATELNLPLVTRERLVIAALSRWLDEYNFEVLTRELEDEQVESVSESYFDESDEEGWTATRYP